MELTAFEQYQMTAEKLKDDVLNENRKLIRKLSEKDQSFELVKMVHFNKTIDLRALNDIIIGCTGCLHSLMFYHHQVITDMNKESDLYKLIIANNDLLSNNRIFQVTENIIPDFTVVMYPVETSELLSDSKRVVHHILMLYPTKRMTKEVLDFAKSFMIVNDVLINIVLTRSKMLELIETDPLTHALNRSSWIDNLTDLAQSAEPYFVIFFDLDNFKMINDSLGHQAGDEILKNVSQWLKGTFRGDDRLFRLGGDEFAVTGYINIEHIDGLINKLNGLNQQFKSAIQNDMALELTVSIGALLSNHSYTISELYTIVDELLYLSKKSGRDTIKLIKNLV